MAIIQMMFTDEYKRISSEKGGARELRECCEHSFRLERKVMTRESSEPASCHKRTSVRPPEHDI